jgi:hypothetical protein
LPPLLALLARACPCRLCAAPTTPTHTACLSPQVALAGALDKGEEFDLMSRLQGLRTGSRR